MVNRLPLLLTICLVGCSTFEDPDGVHLQPECVIDADCDDAKTCASGVCQAAANNGTNNGCDLSCDRQADRCEGNIRIVHDGPGRLTDRCACDYDAVERQINCADDDMLCRGGACVSACVEVDCTAPADACDGDVAVTHTGPGVCADPDATCDFSGVEERTDCVTLDPPRVCANGVCVDLCAEVTCEIAQPACDGSTLVTTASNLCDPATGQCVPEPVRTDCSTPSPACDGDDRLVFTGEGTCDQGACAPPETFERHACDFGCNAGSCRSADSVLIEPGTFLALGTRPATLRGGFLMMAAEVTRADHARWGGEVPEDPDCDAELCPRRGLSWYDAALIANARSVHEGLEPCYDVRQANPDDQTTWSVSVSGEDGLYACRGYRMPTDAEWEFAHRAGAGTTYLCGEDAACLDAVAWHADNSDGEPHPVRGKSPNAWGLYDIAGNVSEHVHDRFAAEADRVYGDDPTGPDTGAGRVSRDCHFGLVPSECAAAANRSLAPSDRLPTAGVRLVRSLRCTADSCPALAPQCDGDLLIERDSPGTCDWVTAACEYDPTETLCAETQTVCRDRACVDLCLDTSCAAPAPACVANTAITYDADGVCTFTDGTCDFTAVERQTVCTDGRVCRQGVCVDLCEGVDCGPQAPFCDENAQVVRADAGRCNANDGTCDYTQVETRTECGETQTVCTDGACVDLCPDDACPVPAPTCDVDTRLQYIGPGQCDWPTGDCDYSQVTLRTNCAEDRTVCQDGACVDLCPPSCPPSQECGISGDLLLYREAGTCSFRTGECNFAPEDADLIECDHCALGACMVRVEPGTFLMGEAHVMDRGVSTTLTRPYYLQATEVNQALLAAHGIPDFSLHSNCGPLCPADNVTWFEAAELANAMSEAEGLPPCYTIERNDSQDPVDWRVLVGGVEDGDPYECQGYRLPTEAEWERAYRAGSDDPWLCGDNPECMPAYAWYDVNAIDPVAPRPVAALLPNGFSLYDMAGNNGEYVHDIAAEEFGGADPYGPVRPPTYLHRVRGGNFMFSVTNVTAHARGETRLGLRYSNVGFRIARTIHEPPD